MREDLEDWIINMGIYFNFYHKISADYLIKVKKLIEK